MWKRLRPGCSGALQVGMQPGDWTCFWSVEEVKELRKNSHSSRWTFSFVLKLAFFLFGNICDFPFFASLLAPKSGVSIFLEKVLLISLPPLCCLILHACQAWRCMLGAPRKLVQRSSEGLHLPRHERLYQGPDMDGVEIFRNDCRLGGIHLVASLMGFQRSTLIGG